MYDDIAEETGMDKKTLWEYKNVSQSIKPSARAEQLTVTKKESARVLARQQYCCCVRPQFATVFPWNHPNGIYITQHLYKSNLRHFSGDLRHSGQK